MSSPFATRGTGGLLAKIGPLCHSHHVVLRGVMDHIHKIALSQGWRTFEHRTGHIDGVEREASRRAPYRQFARCDLLREFNPDLRLEVSGNGADNLVEQFRLPARSRRLGRKEDIRHLAQKFATLFAGVLFCEFNEKCEVVSAVGHDRLQRTAGRYGVAVEIHLTPRFDFLCIVELNSK